MSSTNRVILSGRVARPPRRHCRPDGAPVLQFSLELKEEDGCAVPRRPGRHETRSSLIDVVAIGELADSASAFVQEGQPLEVEGRIHQRKWQTPEGKSRSHVEVIATEIRKPGGTDGAPA